MSIKQVLVAVDQLINAIFGGYADETLSSRAWRARDKQPWLYKSIDKLFFWDVSHCCQSYYSEKLRRQFPPELR